MKDAGHPALVYRLGRLPDAWAWPDWSFAGADGTFGNRFDDPLGVYRVLYASTQRLGTFVECLAYFRPDPEVFSEYEAIDGDPDDGDEPPGPGVVPAAWLEQRGVGEGRPTGRFVELGHSETLAVLRSALAARMVHHGVHDLDAAAIRLSVPREFTQDISRHVFDQTGAGIRRWDGITYRSKHGDELENRAFFEPAAPEDQVTTPFDLDDPDLAHALQLHKLTLSIVD